MKIKIKIENTTSEIDGIGRQVEITPRLSFFWDTGAYCLGFGWLFLSIDFWFGDIAEMM